MKVTPFLSSGVWQPGAGHEVGRSVRRGLSK